MPHPTQPETTLSSPAMEPVEVPQKQVEDLADRLGMLNEVVAKRQEEADQLKHELIATQAQIGSSKRQWQQEQMQSKQTFAIWKQEQEETIAIQQNNLNLLRRKTQESLERTQNLEGEIRQKLLELLLKEEEFKQLAQDRIDTSTLRAQAEAKMQEAQTLFGHAQHTQNQGTAVMVDAKRIREECEERNRQMTAAWDKCRAWEEELRLKSRDVEIREQDIKRREATLQAENAAENAQVLT